MTGTAACAAIDDDEIFEIVVVKIRDGNVFGVNADPNCRGGLEPAVSQIEQNGETTRPRHVTASELLPDVLSCPRTAMSLLPSPLKSPGFITKFSFYDATALCCYDKIQLDLEDVAE